MRRNAALATALLIAACQQPVTPTPAAATEPAPPVLAPQPPASAAAAARSTAGREVSIENDLYSFWYAYPAQAAAIPALASQLDADLEGHKARFAQFARDEQANARESGFDYRKVDFSQGWAVVTDLPGWLSLSASIGSYEGGAHPNHRFTALLWDKAAGKRREVAELFTSRQALSDVLRAAFCREIDRQREEKRGEPVRPGTDDPFAKCIDPVASTVILGSSNRKTFDRIGVLVDPYEAGPYVEGGYEVTLPVTAQILAAVRPDYRASFSIKR